MNSSERFVARVGDLLVEEVGDELVIYDRRADVAHCLGSVAGLVWHECEKGASLDEIAGRLVADDIVSSDEDASELAQAALAELVEKNLIETSGAGASLVSRRQALRTMAGVGAAAVVAPLIVSAAVPRSASAHGSLPTCKATGVACTPASTANAGNNCCTSNGDYCSSSGAGQKCVACVANGSTCFSDYQCCSGDCSTSTDKCIA